MVDSLAARLKDNPNDSNGWAMLARSYKALGRFEESRQAFEKAGDIVKTDPDLLIDHADVLGVLAGNSLVGKPQQMIEAALRMNPEHPMSLMMAGVASYQNGDYPKAVTYWEKLLGLLQPGSPDALQVQANIDEARAKGGQTAGAEQLAASGARGCCSRHDTRQDQ